MPAPIENISDTARWVALYRAMESERPDAHFRDPHARRLAGERGEAIAAQMPGFQSGLWPMVVRTCLFDELVARTIRERGVDTVVNLAAGLDARPWRMSLPPGLRWIEVDLPAILAYKSGLLGAERPACAHEFVAADLTDAGARRELLARVGRESKRALVLTEGLLVYLSDDDVGALAADLHASPAFGWWIIDIVAPQLLRRLNRRWGASLAAGRAELRFAPAEGTRWFEKWGWREAEYRSTFEEARRLKREMRGAWIWRLVSKLMPPAKWEEVRRMGGVALLERT